VSLTAAGQFAHRRRGIGAQLKAFESAFWARNDETGKFEPQNSQDGNDDLVEFRTPARAPTVESDVKVPFLQATITGIFLAPAAVGTYHLAGGTAIVPACFTSVLVCVGGAWMIRMGVMTKLLWQIEKYSNRDIDKDGYEGEPPPSDQPRNRTVIDPQGDTSLPKTWMDLDEAVKVLDVHHFAEIVWSRQEGGLGIGQKALRKILLPSGFEINDDIHGWILDDLNDAGVIYHSGNGWRLKAPPSVVKNRIRIEVW
jgi:hypothetical protein